LRAHGTGGYNQPGLPHVRGEPSDRARPHDRSLIFDLDRSYPPGASMSRLTLFSSSVGTKIAIALTGIALVGFLIMHLAGNLLILIGGETFNAYSHKLISNPLLIPVEIALLAIFLVHVYKTVRMFLDNRLARPTAYAEKRWAGHTSRKSLASSTMIVTGLVTFVFVWLHLKTFKYGPYYEDAEGVRDLNRLVLEVFSQPAYVAFYVVCMVLIGFHLRHGVASAFQSLGISDVTNRLVRVSLAIALLIGGGFALIPLWIYFFAR
jgi:succinate dehydrogenase / fumarate reductase cytochrome b subunit